MTQLQAGAVILLSVTNDALGSISTDVQVLERGDQSRQYVKTWHPGNMMSAQEYTVIFLVFSRLISSVPEATATATTKGARLV